MKRRKIKSKKTAQSQAVSQNEKHYFDVANLSNYVLPEDIIRERTDYEMRFLYEKYVPFFDEFGDFHNVLCDSLLSSPTFQCVLEQKVQMTMGDTPILERTTSGRGLFQRSEKPKSLSDVEISKYEAALLNVNNENQTILEVLEQAIIDYYAVGNSFVQVAKLKHGDKFEYKFTNIATEKVRLQKKNEITGAIDTVGISENWNDMSVEPVSIPLFPNFGKTKSDKVVFSVIHIKRKSKQTVYYGMPEIATALLHCALEYKIPKHNNSKLTNGFMPSSIMQFFGQYSKNDAKKLVDSVVSKFTKPENANKIFVQVLRDEKSKAHIQTLNDNYEGNFMELDALCTQKIVTALNWSMPLAGIAQAGKLGTNEQIKNDYEICMSKVVRPTQTKFANKLINPILDLLFPNQNLVWKFSDVTPITFFGTVNIDENLTTTEKRELLGYGITDAIPEYSIKPQFGNGTID